MNVSFMTDFFLYGFLINFAILIFWAFAIMVAKQTVKNYHAKFIPLTDEQFNFAHYMGLAIFKLMIFVFFLVPYIVLRILG